MGDQAYMNMIDYCRLLVVLLTSLGQCKWVLLFPFELIANRIEVFIKNKVDIW